VQNIQLEGRLRTGGKRVPFTLSASRGAVRWEFIEDISSPVHATEFAVDLSSRRFPRDWRDRLYWIVGDSISSPINPFIEHSREIRRVKITVP
jgi:hypothetical protein